MNDAPTFEQALADLETIIHDLEEGKIGLEESLARYERGVALLRHCRDLVPAEGSLLVIEFVLPDVISGPAPELVGRFMSDLNMLAVTSGRERSEREWRELLEDAGFTLTRNVPVPEMDVSILEAHPTVTL